MDEDRAVKTLRSIGKKHIMGDNLFDDVADIIERRRAERVDMLAALRWYADPEVYKPNSHGIAFDRRDLSYVARAAIAKVEGK